ncbi:YecA family protein [Oscillochloris sp. ZM17-4]|uniref:YecA family protein n=1 Tax=Oscillochloris sp. ZM17-4 TaxID=2866714 RepID=UPI00351D57A3
MKVGRNDPCPCGSGKKYKKCCLAKDEAAARQAAHERATAFRAIEPLAGDDPFAGFPSYTPPPPPEPRPRSPEDAAREELWETFEAADAAEQTALFRRALADGVLDDEYAYEMLTQLRDEAGPALWGTLVEELRDTRPDLYAHSAPYYLEWQIADALAVGHIDHLPALAAALAATAGDDLDMFYLSRDRLAYHGHLALLAETMAQAWPLVRASDKFISGADEEFAAEAQQITMLAYLDRRVAPRADDPALLAAVEQFGPVDFPEALADQIALITGQADRPWDRADDPEDTRINRLGFRFQGELVRRWGMPLGRAGLARVALLNYIAERHDPDSSIAQAVRRPKGKHKPAASTASDLLCPDRESLDRYVAQKLSFLSSRVIEAAVTLEAVPAWLHFLYDQGVITAERRADALHDLGKLVQQAEPIWAQHPSDPALGPNIRAAWERAAEG